MIKTVSTTLICSNCGSCFPIMRRANKQKNYFHIKDLYCPQCKRVTKHIEAKDLDLLLSTIEFKELAERTPEEQKIYQLVKRKSE